MRRPRRLVFDDHDALERAQVIADRLAGEFAVRTILTGGVGGECRETRFGCHMPTQRAQQPTMMELLNDLTVRIPDDTVLEKFSFNEGRMVLVGQSRQAAALVGLLQASPLLLTPAIAGAMQPDPRTGMDRFTLTGTVVGSPQEVADGKAQQSP